MKQSKKESGSILLAVLMVVMVAVAVVGAAYLATASQASQTARSADLDAGQSTAEGLLDYSYGQWKSWMDTQGFPGDSDLQNMVGNSNLPSVPSNMTLDYLTITAVDGYGAPVSSGSTSNGTVTGPPPTYDYKMNFNYNYMATVKLRVSAPGHSAKDPLKPNEGVPVTMRRMLVYTAVPPTRGMFYSEGDFELYKPAKMVIGGDVHTNGSAHVSTGTGSSNLEFLSTSNVSYVGSYDNAAPAGATSWNNSGANYAPTYDNGLANQVKKVPQITGIGIGTAAQYDTTDTNPNNDGNRELIEPPVSGFEDPAAIASSRLYDNAGLLITVSGLVDNTATLTQQADGAFTGGNISIKPQNGTTLTDTQAATVRNAVVNSKTSTTQTYVSSGYYTGTGWNRHWVDTSQWVTTTQTVQKTLFDKREVQNVAITDVNIGSITPTLNSLSSFNGIVYIYDTANTGEKAIRITNGGVLPDNGLTIATEDGMYVQGDYNTGTTTNSTSVPSNSSPAANASTTVSGYSTKSAALVADAIMVLSNNWSDSNASSSVGSRAATNTTLNTALIAGYIPSANGGNNGRSGYSGGMNNFPRFLESWSGANMTFSGAFVSLYQSKIFTGSWDTGDIYSPPTRYWYFDTLLLSRVLPGIPPSGGCVRGQLSRL